ncbi:PREDICTED: putative GPI-anchored protein PB15E9.01c [Ceratosolen solmsi marchali]|uniref:GPI-anchored protein PB15E9.01c n=1 Tax=Ceratosolen solmsi marchali TaxID=326594 RepID=A0AAJ7DUS7_9HYME|nr:PREDICTED: putative GPI-anchored protein PB15E9.01c [Ceratosolen solmsi marchali]
MWEPGSGDSGSGSGSIDNANANANANRGFVVLLTALSFCVLLYKAWGPLLFITCALVLVVHTCYSLLVNDSLFAPHTLVLLRYARGYGLELALALKLLFALGIRSTARAFEYLKRRYDVGCRRRFNESHGSPGSPDEDMNGRQRNAYRLSTTAIDMAERPSPINHDPYRAFALNGACDGARTSTPIPRGSTWTNAAQVNGDLGQFISINSFTAKKTTTSRCENKQPSITLPRSEETLYSPKGSPWGNSISPKMRDRNVIKTVQTVAGPLLASTRYNIDPKIYTDVSSPGFTTRLTKYAAEANNKLTHQPQYGTGQFPKVNLHASPTPLLSPKIARARIPVTVRVAPPEIINYSPTDSHSHQERHKMFPNNSGPELKESTSCPNIDPVLKKISLKRHASREDMLDIAKKQRAEKMYYGQLENLEEMMQKRSRDESMTSEDDLSPQSKTQRPTKRSKASSCHDILHSLSSSLNVFSGVKRKAIDTSRCNTPDIEKHFKSSSKSPNRSSSFTIHPEKEVTNSKEQLNTKVSVINASGEPHQPKKKDRSSEKLKTSEHSQECQSMHTTKDLNYPTPKASKGASVGPKDANLTDKLFMRAEPQTNEKLKILIEEQGNIEAKFTVDGKDEIKKKDIVNMRQNSMRLRLQSMFDAISGKSASKIDPDVVIQAEEVNPTTSSNYTSLNSQTSTTTVNASPIVATIVPILKSDTEPKSPSTKHVTFDLPVNTSSETARVGVSSPPPIKESVDKSLGKEVPTFDCFTSAVPPLTFSFGSVVAPSTSNSTKLPTTNGTMGAIISCSPTGFTSIPDISKSFTFTASSSEFTSESVARTVTSTVSTPVISSASASTTSAKSTNLNTTVTIAISSVTTTSGNTLNFANPLLNSSPTMSVARPTITLPSSTSNKKESGGFTFGAVTANSNSIGNLGQSSPSLIFSSIASTAAMTTAAAPVFTFSAANKTSSSSFSFGSMVQPIAATAPSMAPSTTSSTSFGTGAQQALATSTGSSTIFPAITNMSGSTSITGKTFWTFRLRLGLYNVLIAAYAPNVILILVQTVCVQSTPLASMTPTFGSSVISPFGATNSSSLFSGSPSTSTPATIFKSQLSPATSIPTSAPTSTIFGSHVGISTFGASAGSSTSASSMTSGTTTASTNFFGGIIPAKPGTTSTIPSMFGKAVPTTTSTTTSPRSTFGDSTGLQQKVQPTNIFSGTTSGATSIFGSSTTTSASSMTVGLFSNCSPAVQNTSNLVPASSPSDSTNIFGQTKSPTSVLFGTSSSSFGQTKPTSSFAMPSTSSPGTSLAFLVSQPQSAVPSSNTIFGSTFGSTASTSSGSSSGSFATHGTASTSTFGIVAPAHTPSFGSGSGTSPFGGQSNVNQTPSLFGNVAAPTATSFSFGANQQQTQAQTQVQSQPQPQSQSQPLQTTTTSFSFGSTGSTGTSGNTGGLFQFGGSTSNKSTGFNFNAPTATPSMNFTGSTAPSFNSSVPPQGAPPAFNAPTTNMFSIGSSSSSPRPRTSRQRRQR